MITSAEHSAKPAPKKHDLRRQLTRFVGRERELAEVKGLLADTACSLLTLVGPGRIGKTRLAVQVASEMSHAFTGGVCFVDLSPVRSLAFLASAIVDALNPPSPVQKGQDLRAAPSGQRSRDWGPVPSVSGSRGS